MTKCPNLVLSAMTGRPTKNERGSHLFLLWLALTACGSAQVDVDSRSEVAAREEAGLTPAYDGRASVVDEGERWIFGGLRVEARGERLVVSEHALQTGLLTAQRTDSGWVFLADDDSVWSSETFTGPLHALGVAPLGVRVQPSRGILLVQAADFRLYRTDGSGPLEAFASLEDYGVMSAQFESPARGRVVEAGGRILETRDGGLTFEDTGTIATPETAEGHLLARAPTSVLVRLLAAALVRYPGLAAVDSELDRVGDVLAWSGDGSHGFLVDGSFRPIPSPRGECTAFVALLVGCLDDAEPSGGILRVYATDARRWRDVRIREVKEPVAFNPQAVLFDEPCGDASDGMCWVDRASGDAVNLARPSDEDLRLVGVLGDEVVFADPLGRVIRRDHRTGREGVAELFSATDLARLRASGRPGSEVHVAVQILEDGSLLADASGPTLAGSMVVRAAHVLRPDGALHTLSVPDEVTEVRMLDARFGVAVTEDGRWLTRDGGGSWSPLGFTWHDGWVQCRRGACWAGSILRPDDPERSLPVSSTGRMFSPRLAYDCSVRRARTTLQVGDASFDNFARRDSSLELSWSWRGQTLGRRPEGCRVMNRSSPAHRPRW